MGKLRTCRNWDCERRYRWRESTAESQHKSWCSELCRQVVLGRRRAERKESSREQGIDPRHGPVTRYQEAVQVVGPSGPVLDPLQPMGPPQSNTAPERENPGERQSQHSMQPYWDYLREWLPK